MSNNCSAAALVSTLRNSLYRGGWHASIYRHLLISVVKYEGFFGS